MYKAFKINGNNIIDDSNSQEYTEYLSAGKHLYHRFKKNIEENLSAFRKADGTLNGRKLTSEWFPLINADVFISHSHKDINTALLLSGFLYKKQNLLCFIDSCVWGYADVLLKSIDNEYCRKNNGSYSYEKRNFSTSHVHMMLSIALTKMIYNTECLLFLNTPNSICPKDVIPDNLNEDETLSPWIHTEIEMTKLVQSRSPEEHRIFQKSFCVLDEGLAIKQPADTSNMELLKYEKLYSWADRKYKDKFDALNNLYTINKKKPNVVYGSIRR